MRYESKISNNKLQFPRFSFWWEGRQIISVCILVILLFITPVNAQFTNGNFSAGTTGWVFEFAWSVSGGQALYSHSTTNSEIRQSIDTTGYDQLQFYAAPGVWGTNYIQVFVGSTGGYLEIRPGDPTGIYTINLTNPGVHNFRYKANNLAGFFQSRADNFTLISSTVLPSINFNPDVESTTTNDLYFDYNVGSDYTSNNTFVYSFYEPNTLNISTFELYTNDSGENINMSTAYLKGNYSINLYTGPFGPASLEDAVLLASDTIFVNTSTVDLLEYTQDTYEEYGTSIVNYNISSYKLQYPADTFYLTMLTPQSSYSPYYYTEIYELTENTGSRSLDIGVKSSVSYPNYQNATAWITKYNDTAPYVNLGDAIYANVSSYNHTLIQYSGYDWPINKSYETGQYVTILSDIKEYIETDYLGYPDEQFKLWIYAYSNSNEGNKYTTHILDSGYWAVNRPVTYQFDYKPYTGYNFNATLESYITVYRNGNTTQLTPTIYSNMYAVDYIPEGEEGYIPPIIPEEPEEPQIPNGTELPENPTEPEIPENQTGAINQSINLSWTDSYYTYTNSTLDGLFSPIQNFTIYAVTPVTLLNESISSFNYEMNISFTETTQKMQLLTESFNIIVSSIHPKVVNVITYYLMWLILLIILRKR